MGQSDDVAAIRALIERQFASLTWTDEAPGQWESFAGDFHPDAVLFPSARPAMGQSVEAFLRRMKGLADGALRTFREKTLGSEIRVFGNIAVATTACEIVENEAATSRNVEMMLLVKTDGIWTIVAQAWDGEAASQPIPPDLLVG